MDLRHLRYFVSIVEHGSLTRAAESLHVAQPALSQHLKRLEAELGCQLVLRTPRGIVATESGERLVELARDLLERANALAQEIRGAEAEPGGPVTVGIPTSLGTVLSVPLALAVRRHHPRIRLRVVEGLSGHILEWVRAREVDVALVFGSGMVSGLVMRAVATENLHLVARRGDAALAGFRNGRGDGAVPFAALTGLPLILPGRPHGVREEVEDTARRLGLGLNVVLEMDALDHIKALVSAGAGYTVLSQRVARVGTRPDDLDTAPIADPAISRTIHLAHAADRPLSIAAKVIHDLIADHLDQLTSNGRWRDDIELGAA